MKITQEKSKKKFSPITIKIETEREATIFWHQLNHSPDDNYLDEYKNLSLHFESDAMKIWEKFDKLFTVEYPES